MKKLSSNEKIVIKSEMKNVKIRDFITKSCDFNESKRLSNQEL